MEQCIADLEIPSSPLPLNIHMDFLCHSSGRAHISPTRTSFETLRGRCYIVNLALRIMNEINIASGFSSFSLHVEERKRTEKRWSFMHQGSRQSIPSAVLSCGDFPYGFWNNLNT